MTRGKLVLVGVVVVVVAAILAWVQPWGARPTTEPPVQARGFRIGVVLPYSGSLAAFGEEGKQGIELAVAEFASQPDADLTVSVIYEDSKGDPADSVRAFRKLVDVDNVDAVIGEVVSSNTLAIAPIADELRVPLVVPASTNEDITRGREFVVRVCFLDPQQGRAMADYALQQLGIKHVALLFDKGSDYSAGLASAFRDAFAAAGGQVVGESTFQPQDQDFRAQLVQIRNWQPEAVFLPANYPQAAQAIRQARQVGLECQFLGGDAWSSPELFQIGGDAVNGCYITAHFAPDNVSGPVRDFVSSFRERYGTEPSNMAALSYDAARLVLRAATMRTAETAEALRDALRSTRDFPGATGEFSIGRDGNPMKEIVILETAEGRFRYVATVPPRGK